MIAKEGIPFILIPLAAVVVLAVFQVWIIAAAFALVAAFMVYFFRDPNRNVPIGDDIVVSAADGKVTRIETNENGNLVSVFLSPIDVHINRSPIAGKITKVEYIAGKKMPATSNHASLINERNSLTIQGEKMTVVCTQIAGILARRIVCRAKESDNLELGQRFGMIKFSSRTDVLMPANVDILVKIGDRVIGGETVIGRLSEGYHLPVDNYQDPAVQYAD